MECPWNWTISLFIYKETGIIIDGTKLRKTCMHCKFSEEKQHSAMEIGSNYFVFMLFIYELFLFCFVFVFVFWVLFVCFLFCFVCLFVCSEKEFILREIENQNTFHCVLNHHDPYGFGSSAKFNQRYDFLMTGREISWGPEMGKGQNPLGPLPPENSSCPTHFYFYFFISKHDDTTKKRTFCCTKWSKLTTHINPSDFQYELRESLISFVRDDDRDKVGYEYRMWLTRPILIALNWSITLKAEKICQVVRSERKAGPILLRRWRFLQLLPWFRGPHTK